MLFPRFIGAVGLCLALTVHGANAQAVQNPLDRIFGQFTSSFGSFGLSGNAVDAGEADTLALTKTGLLFGMPVGEAVLMMDLSFVGTNSTGFDDTYTVSAFGALHYLKESRNGYAGFFGGAVHTEQDNTAFNSSRRWFYGVEGSTALSDTSIISGQIGYICCNGGNDSKGRQSISKARFAQVRLTNSVSKATDIAASIAVADGIFDYMTGPGSPVQLWTAGLTVSHKIPNTAATVFASLEISGFHDAADSEHLFERRIMIGFSQPFGATGARTTIQRQVKLAPIARWVAQTGGPLE